MPVPPLPYDRAAAVAYAKRWALDRNPLYYDFSRLGGDCTNFASQCILAGCDGRMNFTPVLGWYYRSLNDRAPAWTGVEFLMRFLTRTKEDTGPFARLAPLSSCLPGDLIQLRFPGSEHFGHSPVVVAVDTPPTPEHILLAAHSDDAWRRPLSSYRYQEARCLHLLGFR